MPIGVQPTVMQANSDLQNMAIQMKHTQDYVQRKVEFYTNLGHAGLVGIGMADADATAFMAKISDFAAVTGVWFGTQFQGTLVGNCIQFNFDNDTALLWGTES